MVDRLTRTFHHAGIPHEIRIYPPKRLFDMFENGQIHFLLAGANQLERFKDVALFTDKQVMSITLRAYAFNKNIPLPQKKEDLDGLKVATIRGYSYAGYLKHINDPENNIIKNSVNSHRSGFLMLLSGRSDILLDYAAPAQSTINTFNEFEFRYNTLLDLGIYFAISKRYPDPKQTLMKIIKSDKELNPE